MSRRNGKRESGYGFDLRFGNPAVRAEWQPIVESDILILMPAPKLTNEIIIAAIAGFESQKTRIDAQIAELRAMLPVGRVESVGMQKAPSGSRRKMSAAARKRMREGQQRRWARIRGESESAATSGTPEPSKPKRKLSAAGRAAIVAALKKRWREKKAGAKTTADGAKRAGVTKSAAKKA